MKRLIKSTFRALGFEIRRCRPANLPVAGSPSRPISNIRSFLEDVRARGFMPQGIIDVGANKGAWTRMALGLFPYVPTILIEPQDEMAEILTVLSRSTTNCRYIKAGVGKREEELIQTIWDDLAGSSFLPEVDSQQLDAGRQRRTKIVTIDSILGQPDNRGFKPDLVKLDIQGFELEALKGAAALFGATELFIVETSLFSFLPRQPITRDVITFMAERGYEFYDITEHLRRPYDGALAQVDLAFVKNDGRFRQSNKWCK